MLGLIQSVRRIFWASTVTVIVPFTITQLRPFRLKPKRTNLRIISSSTSQILRMLQYRWATSAEPASVQMRVIKISTSRSLNQNRLRHHHQLLSVHQQLLPLNCLLLLWASRFLQRLIPAWNLNLTAPLFLIHHLHFKLRNPPERWKMSYSKEWRMSVRSLIVSSASLRL